MMYGKLQMFDRVLVGLAVMLVSIVPVMAHGECDGCDGHGPCKKKVSQQCGKCAAENLRLAKDKFLAGLNEIRNDNWEKAMLLYKEAAGIETRLKASYTRQADLLQQAIKDRSLLSNKKLSDEEKQKVKSVWSYCVIRKAYVPAMDIAEKFNKILPSTRSAELLADTYMLCDKNEQAWRVIAGLDRDELSIGSKLTYIIVSARLGKSQNAKSMLALLTKENIPGKYRLKYAAALALCGESDKSLAILKSAVSGGCGMKSKRLLFQIRSCDDFKSLRDMAEYKAMFKSKTSSCRTCPNRNKCSEKK